MDPDQLADLNLHYCKFRNFPENFIFANSNKRHVCNVKNSLLGHDLPTSVNDSDFAISRGFTFTKLLEIKTLTKISKLTVF